MRISRYLAVALLAALTGCGRPPQPISLHSDDLGTYRVHQPAGTIRRLVFAFGSANDTELDAAVDKLVDYGALVARVDVAQFAAGAQARKEQCVDVAGIVNWHANYLGRRYGLEDLEPPLLVGHGIGAGLVYALLAQAPSLTFAGAVTDTPQAQLPFGVELCGVSSAPGANGQITLNAAAVSGLWHVVGGKPDDPLLRAVKENSPDDPPGLVADDRFAHAAVHTLDVLEAEHPPQSESIADLQVVELPAKHPSDTLAVIYSGDGGWRDLDKTIGGLLAEQGTAVVGIDVVRYFWHQRSPERTATDLGRILEHYRSLWHIERVALIGYSFGAEVLPFAYNRLPDDWQQRVATVALLAPGRTASFEVTISGWLGKGNRRARPILPELVQIPASKVLCVYGSSEIGDSLCTQPGTGNITRLERPGDHHFDRRYSLIADAIRTHLEAPPAAPKSPATP
jgi:type IV secretory pathway VirJ component